ncbi:transporter [Vibrio splendidus]|uniref:transporter n=1 Tax=Vibrio splendidus TaxID=29497 RepID=UPI0007F953D4|nr:transporter [Vibrio splendidus]OBT32332.1 transporter [Vibrio splendidus]
MDKQIETRVEFDYTTFLGASCSKKWTFLEALTTIAPVFSTVWRDSIKELASPEDRLWQMALKSMSTRKSDESNIVTLLKLARLEGINELKVVMPYSLEEEQIEYIETRSHLVVAENTGEELTIKL